MPDLLQMVTDFFAGSPLAPDLFLFIERDPANLAALDIRKKVSMGVIRFFSIEDSLGRRIGRPLKMVQNSSLSEECHTQTTGRTQSFLSSCSTFYFFVEPKPFLLESRHFVHMARGRRTV
jgi:hypothetical protein